MKPALKLDKARSLHPRQRAWSDMPRAPNQGYNIVHISQPQRRWHLSRAWPARRDPRSVRSRQLLLRALGLACSAVCRTRPSIRDFQLSPRTSRALIKCPGQMRVSAAAVCVAVAQAFVPMPAALRLATGATYVHPLAPPISSLALSARVREATPTHIRAHTRRRTLIAYPHAQRP